ncbi:polyphosphate kinase 1 [Pendulispora brunnea]|uniref:Polyphosphate kinase n=1 Tax=Pendulispora brunnea TaxID=2905690 RepID=A0ABZ2K8C2_9BACT
MAPIPSSTHGPASSGNLNGPTYSAPHLLISDGVPDLRSPYLYLNRELSWLEFNARVLAEGENEAVPLLERLKFHAIFASNLDEFFMVRVAGLKQQMTGEVGDLPPDGMTPAEQLAAVSLRVHAMVAQQSASLETHLLPRLAEQGTLIVRPERLSQDQLAQLDQMFHNEIFPILTPIAVDPGHPFPHLRNKSLNIGVMFAREGEGHESGFGVVQVPVMLPRLIEVSGVRLPDGSLAKHAFVLLEALISRHVGTIFPGVRVKGVYSFRVTRNFDLELDEEEAEDLLQMIQQELRRRERGNAVRLEVAGEPTPGSLMKLVKALKLDPERDVYRTSGMLNMADLMRMVSRDERRELRDEPFAGYVAPPLRDAEDLFALVRENDVVLQHPYDSYDTIVDFITRAADDPDVLAIKQTLYRAGGDSPIIKALTRAAEAGKQVTAIVELKARFDEESNIQWARTLEQAGVNVVYGLLGLKTHAKCLLIVRREKGKLRRYVHLATGNYNPTTARMYTDVSLLTCKPQIGEDASSLFNLLTGYSAPPKWNSLIVAPLGLHEAVLGLIQRETDHAKAGRPARIIAKMNALVDEDVIEALYRASQAGVSITLLVRGICCLRPGVAKVSDTIEVRAIVDRFLEHGRILYFANGGKEEVFIASADWMPRNFHRRVEVLIPIEDPTSRTRLIEVLHLQCADNVKSWFLRSDGSYMRVAPPAPGQPAVRAQQRFMELARDRVKTAETAGRPTRFHLQTMPARQLDAPRVRRRREAPPVKK